MNYRVIYKYPLFLGRNQVTTPQGRVVHVGKQGENLCIWFLADIDTDPVERSWIVVSTGQGVPYDWTYLGTSPGDHLVWHVFEAPE